MEFIKMYAKGMIIKQIADKKGISVSYVEKKLREEKIKIGAKTLANAVYIAAKSGLICVLVAISIGFDGDVLKRLLSSRTANRSPTHQSQTI